MERTRPGRVRRWAVRLLGGLLVLAVMTQLVLETPWAHEQARRLIESRVNAALNGELRIGALTGSFWGHVTLADVRVTHAGVPVISATAVGARYRPWRVFTSGTIDELVLTGLNLDLIETSAGWNVAGLFGPQSPEPRSGPRISIARLQIVGSKLDVRPVTGRVRRLADLQLLGTLDYEPRRIRLVVDGAAGRDVETGLVVRDLAGAMRVENDVIEVDDLRVATAASRIAGSLQLTTSSGGRHVDATIDAAPLSLPEIALYAPALANVTVTPTVRVTARGPADQLAIQFMAVADEGTVSGQGRAVLADSIARFDGIVEATSLNLAPWLGRPDLAGQVTGWASVDLTVPEQNVERAAVRFAVRAPAVTVADYHARAVDVTGTVHEGVLDVTGTAVAYGAPTRATTRWTHARFTARGDVAQLDLRRLPRRFGAPDIPTRLTGKYDLVFAGDRWRADVALQKSLIDGAEVASGTTVQLNSDRSDLSYTAQGEVSRVDLDRLRRIVAIPHLSGTVNARFDAAGRGTSPSTASANLQLHLVDSSIEGVQIAALDASASLDRRRLVADVKTNLRHLSNESVGVTSRFVADGVADIQVDVVDILAPNWFETDGHVKATFENVTVLETPLDHIQIDASLRSGVATIRTFALESSVVKATAAGTLALDAETDSDLTYEVTAIDLSKLPRVTSQTLTGSAHVTGRLTGPSAQLATSGDLQAHELAFGTFRALALKGRVNASVPNQVLANAGGKFDGDATFIEVGGTRIDRVRATVGYEAGTVDADAVIEQRTRTLRFAGALVPHPQHREVHIRALSAQAGDAEWSLPARQEAIVQYAPDRLFVSNLELVRNDARIRVNGTVDATGTAAEPLSISLERVRVEDINQVLLGTHALAGQLDATARIEGTMAAPRVSVDGTVVAGQVDGVAFERLAGRGDYAAGRLGLDVHLQAGTSGELRAAGSMPVPFGVTAPPASAPPFDLRVESRAINLGLLQPLTSHLEALKGTGTVDLRISGPASGPGIAGDLGVHDAAFRVAPTGVSYRQVNADMRFEGERLTIKQLRLEDDDRHAATVQGGLNLSVAGPPSAFDLYLSAADFHVLKNPLGEISLNLDLHAMGDLRTPLVVGTIEVERARLEVDDLLERFAAGGYTPAPADPSAEAAGPSGGTAGSPLAQASYSITLALPDNVVVRGRDLRSAGGSFGLGDINATLGGALTIAKESGQPTTMVGRLEVVRGQYTFQGRRFTIVRGSELRFRGADMLNPALDVTAERQIGGVVAHVQVTGLAQRPEVALSSTPPLDQGDVLSLIVFNQTMNQLGTADRVSLAGRAGTLAARALATPIADSVMRALDFDLFEIQPNEDVATGATLTVGRQVNDRLFVGFRQNFGVDQVSQVSFEYRISEFLRLVTSFAQGADRSRSLPRAETAGIDLFFVIRR